MVSPQYSTAVTHQEYCEGRRQSVAKGGGVRPGSAPSKSATGICQCDSQPTAYIWTTQHKGTKAKCPITTVYPKRDSFCVLLKSLSWLVQNLASDVRILLKELWADNTTTTNNNNNNNDELASTHIFHLVAMETGGTWSLCAVELVQEIGRRATLITGEPRESTFLFKQLSIALQRGNAVAFLNTVDSD